MPVHSLWTVPSCSFLRPLNTSHLHPRVWGGRALCCASFARSSAASTCSRRLSWARRLWTRHSPIHVLGDTFQTHALFSPQTPLLATSPPLGLTFPSTHPNPSTHPKTCRSSAKNPVSGPAFSRVTLTPLRGECYHSPRTRGPADPLSNPPRVEDTHGR